MNLVDWQTVGPAPVTFAPQDFTHKLLPVLLSADAVAARADASWGATMAAHVQAQLGRIFPLRDEEIELIRLVRNEGKIVGHLITTDDTAMIDCIAQQPMLLWRAQQCLKR